MEELYIIGNGFDMHHGIQSSYKNFKKYVEDNNEELYKQLQRYFDEDALWGDFEATLAAIDMDTIQEECVDYIVEYSSEEWRDRDNHVYAQEVERRLELITKELKKEFLEWILSLQIPESASYQLIKLNNRARFLNFNYTGTLQRLYNVLPQNIKYIHNQALDQSSDLVLGHARNPTTIASRSEDTHSEDSDHRIAQGDELMDLYYKKTFKPTAKVIADNQEYFDSLKDIKTVNILGHSLSLVDRPYLEKISQSVGQDAQWIISYREADKIPVIKVFFNSLGIFDDRLSFVTLPDLLLTNGQIELFTDGE